MPELESMSGPEASLEMTPINSQQSNQSLLARTQSNSPLTTPEAASSSATPSPPENFPKSITTRGIKQEDSVEKKENLVGTIQQDGTQIKSEPEEQVMDFETNGNNISFLDELLNIEYFEYIQAEIEYEEIERAAAAGNLLGFLEDLQKEFPIEGSCFEEARTETAPAEP
ncbi:hypothetical protein EG329_004744 [Mollisiaceae sp. DMI_Dod_QoI]|nr:hypothetical protein EG329_004744 [Helotiales sp. DMI_Dod_QoI]